LAMNRAISLAAGAILSCQAMCAEVPNRTWDRLSEKGSGDGPSAAKVLTADEVAAFGGKQIPLCMIGDSITWAQKGDCWRKFLVKEVPRVAFVGTHTGRFGFSHAGEGGNSTAGVLARIDDRSRVPDAPYYHLMIGINDCSAAKSDETVPRVASNTVVSIWKIIDRLLARQTTRKVFLGSILPVRVAKNPYRDQAGAMANVLIRADLNRRYPSGRVVWVEYERPIRRNLGEWLGKRDLVHPHESGYRQIAGMFAPMLAAQAPVPWPGKSGRSARYGVCVENLWVEEQACTRPLIPGWYVVSFSAGDQNGNLSVRLRNRTDKPNSSYDKTFSVVAAKGRRCAFDFMTGYDRYGYSVSPFHLEVVDGGSNAVHVTNVMVEKMRPSRMASRFGRGVFVDSESPVCEGELLVEEE
nr:SGNH/GDSL hydrolase family protein [Kiritimatiellia bacterium]